MAGRCCLARWPGASTREHVLDGRCGFLSCGWQGEEPSFACTCRSAPCARCSCCVLDEELQGEELSSSCGGRVTFSLRGQRESNPRERPPRLRALRASCPQGSRPGYGVCRQASCPDAKLVRIPANHPAGSPPPGRRFRGGPSTAAGHRGPHSVMKLKSNSEASPGCCLASAPALLKTRATMARCSTRSPCAAVSRGRQAAQRPRLTDLPGRSPASAKRGALSSLVTFALSTQRESDSVAAGDRPIFALNTTRASRTECALAGAGGRKFFAIPSANRNAGTCA